MQAALVVLKERHERVKRLCQKTGTTCSTLRIAQDILWSFKVLDDNATATLGMLMARWLPNLRQLNLSFTSIGGDVGVKNMFEGLSSCSLPKLHYLSLVYVQMSPVGADALALALSNGAMPRLETVSLTVSSLWVMRARSLWPHRCASYRH